jgi:hypothetical protein
MPPPFTEPLTNEDYAWLINYMIVAAEAVLRLNRKDSNGNELLLRERADQILRAASGNRKIEPRFFQLAWLIARTCAITPEQTAGPPCKRIHGHG